MRYRPFITFPQQDAVVYDLELALGNSDVAIKKSRDMGASFICLMVILKHWLFSKGSTFLLVSRTEEYVDSKDPKCLFWKLDFMLKRIPEWLKPKYADRSHMHLFNPEKETTIDGESTTGDVGRGGRTTAMLLDEFAAVKNGYEVLRATRDNTRCRIFNSTYKRASGAFVDLMSMEGVKVLELPWWSHPEKGRGLYIGGETGVRQMDIGYKYPMGYKFICDGKKRSPWYDEECKRGNPQDIATELDMDSHGSDFSYFSVELLNEHKDTYCKVAFSEIDLPKILKIPMKNAGGAKLKTWLHLGPNGRPIQDRDYVAGADIATGTGATPTCFSFGDCRTGEKVAEYVNANIDPVEAGELYVALCRWFGGKTGEAYAVWEGNGPGALFGKTVVGTGFRNFYRKRNEQSLDPKDGFKPGWYSTQMEEKSIMLGEYREALQTGKFINRSSIAVDECKQYVYDKNGKVVHSKSVSTIDYASGRVNHGDMVIADALCWFAMQRQGFRSIKIGMEEKFEIPKRNNGSFAWRRQYSNKRRAQEKEEWK